MESQRRTEHGDTQSELSGRARDVVQAGQVTGGVHFHGADYPLGPVPRQLPGDIRDFVNRESDLLRLSSALSGAAEESSASHVYVIAGTAGVGKTSLAVHWAHLAKTNFADGQLYANMRGYDPGPPASASAILDRFLRALGVLPTAIPADVEDKATLYRSLLAERRMIVVLDNAATVGSVRPLLPGSAGCLVLITSRSRLSGLVARDGAYRLTLDVLPESESVDLLRRTMAAYRMSDLEDQMRDLARLCAFLPLALRVAAERASSRPHIPLDELIQDLRNESALWDLLTARDDEEAGAVRTVFAWSYRALAPEAARLFCLLGLHPGPDFSSGAAAALAGESQSRTNSLLDVLAGVHLLNQTARDRYHFHDLLRAYAGDTAEREAASERHDALVRLVCWYAHTVFNAVEASMYGPAEFELQPPIAGVEPKRFRDHDEALQWYESERVNLVAITAGAASEGLDDFAWQIPAIMHNIFSFRHPFEEWRAVGAVGLDAARRVGNARAEAFLLFSLGKCHTQQQDLARGLELTLRALELQRELGDDSGQIKTLAAAGLAYLRLRHLSAADECFASSEQVAREMGNSQAEAFAVLLRGWVQLELDEPLAAVETIRSAVDGMRHFGDRADEIDATVKLCEAERVAGLVGQALETARYTLDIAAEIDDRVISGACLIELGRIQQELQSPEEALVSYQQAAVIQRRLGNPSREAQALQGSGLAYQQMGRIAEATEFLRRAVGVFRSSKDRWLLAVALRDLGVSLQADGRREVAREMWSSAVELLDSFSDPKAVRLRTALIREMDGGVSPSD